MGCAAIHSSISVLSFGVEGYVAIRVHFADRDVHPERRSDLYDAVGLERDDLTEPKAGAGEDLDDQPGRRGCFGAADVLHELRSGSIIDEPW